MSYHTECSLNADTKDGYPAIKNDS